MGASKDRQEAAGGDDHWTEPEIHLSKDPGDDKVSVIAVELPGIPNQGFQVDLP